MKVHQTFYCIHVRFFLPGNKANGISFAIYSSGSADSVDIVLRNIGNIEIYDMRYFGYIDAAGYDIRGNDKSVFAAFEFIYRIESMVLIFIEWITPATPGNFSANCSYSWSASCFVARRSAPLSSPYHCRVTVPEG